MGFFDWLGGLFGKQSETVDDVADRLERLADRCRTQDDIEGEGLARTAAHRARGCSLLEDALAIERDLMSTLGLSLKRHRKQSQDTSSTSSDNWVSDDS